MVGYNLVSQYGVTDQYRRVVADGHKGRPYEDSAKAHNVRGRGVRKFGPYLPSLTLPVRSSLFQPVRRPFSACHTLLITTPYSICR